MSLPIPDARATRTKAILAFVFFLFLMTGYYLVKPVREATFLHRKGFDKLPLVKAVVAVAGLALVLGYAQFVRRMSRRTLLLTCYGAALAGTAALAGWLAGGASDAAVALYIGVSLFNVLLVCVFWSTVDDVFGVEEGRRWYWLVGLAGPCGALAGSFTGWRLVKWVGSSNLLWVSMPFLFAALAAGLMLDAAGRRHPPPDAPRVRAPDAAFDPAILLRTPYVLFIAGMVTAAVLMTGIVSLDYDRLLGAAGLGEDRMTSWNAGRNMAENVLGIAVQLAATPVLLRRWGPGPALLVHPAAMLAGALALAAHNTLTVATVLIVVSAGIGYTLSQSARELLFVPTDRTIKYRAKAVIDVFCFRLGDAGGALAVWAGLTLGGGEFQPLLILAAAVSVAWLGFARSAGRAFGQLQGGDRP